MWEFIVKKTFPRKSPGPGSDVQAPHSVLSSHKTDRVDSDTEKTSETSRTQHKKKNRKLLCPVCSVEMEIREIGSLEIDQCPRCEGVFLDRGELRILSGVDDGFFQKEEHKYLIYTPHGLSDSIHSSEKNDHE